MKKNTYAKLFGLALTAALTVTALTACGGAPRRRRFPTTPPPPLWYRRAPPAAWAPCC